MFDHGLGFSPMYRGGGFECIIWQNPGREKFKKGFENFLYTFSFMILNQEPGVFPPGGTGRKILMPTDFWFPKVFGKAEDLPPRSFWL